MSHRRINPILLVDVETNSAEEREQITRRVNALVEEDLTCDVAFEQPEQRLVLYAEDELQLEAFCARVQQTSSVRFSELRIGYRETIRKMAEAEGKYIRQTGGSGNYGHCKLRVEPNELGKGYEFINEIKGGVVPKEYIKPIDQGVQGALELGILAGYPIVDVKVILYDGSYHEVDSNEMAFKFAGSIAFKEAARKASPVLLEPVMAVELELPEQLTADVSRDINARRGRVEAVDKVDGWGKIKATIPLAEVLRSSAYGRPEYPLRFARYAIVSPREGPNGEVSVVPFGRPQNPNLRDAAARLNPNEE